MLRCAHLFFQQDEGWGFSQAVGVVVKTEQLLSHTACWDACWPSGCPPCTSAGIARLCQWGRLYVDVCASGCLKYLQAQWVHPSFRKTMLHSDAKIYYVFRECKEISSRVTFTHKRDKMYHFAKVNRFLSEDFAWYFAMKSNAEWDEEQILEQEMHFSTFLLPCSLAVQNFECGWKLAAAGWVLLSKKEEGPGAASLNCIAPAGSHLPAVQKGASGGSHRVPSKVSLEHLLSCMELSLQRCCTVCVQPSGDFWEMKGHHENPMSVADVLWLSRCWEWALLRASEKWSELGSDTCTSKLSCSGRVLQYGKLSSHVETSILVCIS